MKPIDLTTIILTYNEELHIQRCIENLQGICKRIIVIDSFSTDRTVELARAAGAVIFQHKYVNQAQQFQWALDNCSFDTEWVLRLDADEYLTDGLIQEISSKIDSLPKGINAVYLTRRVRFLGRILVFGNLKPVRILRLWRNGTVFMEQRWMDEKLVLKEGTAISFKNIFIDENLKGLTDWTEKHNQYSNREIIVQLDNRYGVLSEHEAEDLSGRNKTKSFYYKMPPFFRAFLYFALRYFVFLGFLDGRAGAVWHTLQAYWYRYLVDAKLREMDIRLGKNPTKEQVLRYAQDYLGLKI